MKTSKSLFFLMVIFYNAKCYSTDYLHQTINGSLGDSWKLNFTQFAKDFKGVILYCIDSNGKYFEMTVKQGNNKKKYINLKYNNVRKTVSLRELCGCDQCNNKMIFNLEFSKIMLKVTCNSPNSVSAVLFVLEVVSVEKDTNNIVNLIPISMVNDSWKIYVMMGNNGPYLGKGNIPVSHLKEQMIGCLESFYFNDNKITFFQEGKKVESACPRKCINRICNGGVCKEDIYSYDNKTCDCSLTPFNGQFCNRSMKIYNKEKNNSFKKRREAKKIILKMTWKTQSPEKIYCLMEFSEGRGIIWTNKSQLMMDNITISTINIKVINFITVSITNNFLIIKNANKESKINFSLDEKTKINVGYSESQKGCKMFEGEYDLHYNSSELQEEIKAYTRNGSFKNNTNSEIQQKWARKVTQLVLLVSITCVFMVFCLILILYIKSRKERKIHMQKMIAMSTVSSSNEIYKEFGVYGQVEESEYEYIDNSDTYLIMN